MYSSKCFSAVGGLTFSCSASFYEALLIPFEISAFTLVLSFWSEDVTKPGAVAGVVAGVIICYAWALPSPFYFSLTGLFESN